MVRTLLAALLALATPPAIDLATLRENATTAIGGADALRALRNVDLTLEIEEAGSTYHARYRATRDGRMRIDVEIDGEAVFHEGVDARGAWEQVGDGDVKDVGDEAEQALRRGVDYKFANIW